YDKETNTFTHYRHDPTNDNSLASDTFFDISGNSIIEDNAGYLWLGTQNGLDKFDKERETFTHYQHDPDNPHSLLNNGVRAVLEAQHGQIWVALQDSGFCQLVDQEKGSFTCYQHSPDDLNSLSSNEVQTLLEDKAGFIWIGTANAVLSKFDPQTSRFTHYMHDPDNPDETIPANMAIRVLVAVSSGELLLGGGVSGGGLIVFDPQTEKFVTYQNDPQNKNSLSDNVVSSIFEDQQGIIWIMHTSGKISKVDQNTQKFSQVKMQDADDPNILWFATPTGGLNKYNRTTESWVRY
ncbi:MAG: hypothetical protein GY712_01585, partial [Oceanicoccus sp.]|uniref:ligand-binding sensor domain-containing protein n=1 Tax=Oceanicoccus sp. TaxID=2691044 RepID=UPI0026341AB9